MVPAFTRKEYPAGIETARGSGDAARWRHLWSPQRALRVLFYRGAPAERLSHFCNHALAAAARREL